MRVETRDGPGGAHDDVRDVGPDGVRDAGRPADGSLARSGSPVAGGDATGRPPAAADPSTEGLSTDARPGFVRRYRLPVALGVVALCLYAGSILYILYGRGQIG